MTLCQNTKTLMVLVLHSLRFMVGKNDYTLTSMSNIINYGCFS